jgi:hypothetical protein
MSFEKLKEDYLSLFGKEGLDGYIARHESHHSVQPSENELLKFNGANLKNCRYFLSSIFGQCGLPVEKEVTNATQVLAPAMNRSFSAAERYERLKLSQDIVVGISPHDGFGAEVSRRENGYLILISHSTLSFCFLYATLAIITMQSSATLSFPEKITTVEEMRNHIEAHETAGMVGKGFLSLRHMIEEFCASGTVKAPLDFVKASGYEMLHPDYVERIQVTYEHFVDFLVLHEIGHITLGHMSNIGSTQRVTPNATYRVANPSVKQEEEADDFAVRALVGKDYQGELVRICDELENRDTNNPEVRKLWRGHTAYGRYISALLILKAFDLFDQYCAEQVDEGTSFTNLCEIGGTHPSGQHRFIRGWTSYEKILPMPSGYTMNIDSIKKWNELIFFAPYVFRSEN